MEKWCSHTKITNLGDVATEGFEEKLTQPWLMPDSTKFCPLCGTPRPKEKSLEEKFIEDEIIYQKESRMRGILLTTESRMKWLAQIATEHFKEKGE